MTCNSAHSHLAVPRLNALHSAEGLRLIALQGPHADDLRANALEFRRFFRSRLLTQ
jgi:hypothetical protein